MSSPRLLTFGQAVHEALSLALAKDPKVICYGLGTDDPKGIFGTTLNLHQEHGSHRVFDMPTSENAMTGVGIGLALNGFKPVMCHQRLDFFLLAMDQLVNHAAKWSFMFGGERTVPLTIRLILGRGWGQGPTHSQNLQAWFAHVPGLKVVMPTSPADAKGLLLSAIFDPNPVLFLEHRWLHDLKGEVPEGDYRVPLDQAKKVHSGTDITLITLSYMTLEAWHVVQILEKEGISCEMIDLLSINPIDWNTLFVSVQKTGKVLVLDTGNETGSVAGEILARISSDLFSSLKAPPKRLCLPDFPTPTSFGAAEAFYPGTKEILEKVFKLLDLPAERQTQILGRLEKRTSPHDVPGEWFRGPF